MESAPTILWKYICFFGGSMPPPYVMKLFFPLKWQRRCICFSTAPRRVAASGFGLFALARRGQYSACGGMDPDARGLFVYVKRFAPARVLGSWDGSHVGQASLRNQKEKQMRASAILAVN